MSDGILTRDEEERLRTFRDSLALEDSAPDSKTLATLDSASSDRIMMEARMAAISVQDGDQHLHELADAIRSGRPRNLAGKWRRPASGYTWSQRA